MLTLNVLQTSKTLNKPNPVAKPVDLPTTSLVVYVSGSCPQNPNGPMYATTVIKHNNVTIYEEVQHLTGESGTNNQAELNAYIRGLALLRTLQKQYPEYRVASTLASASELGTRIMSGVNRPISFEMRDLYERFASHMQVTFPRPLLLWIPKKTHTKLMK